MHAIRILTTVFECGYCVHGKYPIRFGIAQAVIFFAKFFFENFSKIEKILKKILKKKFFFLAQNNFWEILKFSTFFFFFRKILPK